MARAFPHVMVFVNKKECRDNMNALIGKDVMFQKPVKDHRDIVYAHVSRAGQVVDFTDDLLQVLVVEISSGELYLVQLEDVRLIQNV